MYEQHGEIRDALAERKTEYIELLDKVRNVPIGSMSLSDLEFVKFGPRDLQGDYLGGQFSRDARFFTEERLKQLKKIARKLGVRHG